MSLSAHTQIHMYITHPSLVMIVYLQNGVFFFAFIYCLYTHTLHFLPLFPHVCYTFFVVDGHATFFLALFLVYHFVWRLVLHMSMQDIVIT